MSKDGMTEPVGETPPHRRAAARARMTGAVYLLYFLTAVLAQVFMKGTVVAGDAAATANNILTHGRLFRLGIATGLVGTAWYIAMAALFYSLFRPVNRGLSLLAAFFSLVGCAIQAVGGVFQSAPLAILGGGEFASAFNVGQLQALALLSLKLHAQADSVSLVFFGAYCLLLGCLIFKSTFLPRVLGLLMGLAGLGWLTFLYPPFAHHLSPYIQILGVVAEASLMLWLLVKGVDVPRWKAQARATGGLLPLDMMDGRAAP